MKIKSIFTALIAGLIIFMSLIISGCQDDAQIANRNLSKAADNFEVTRRIVFVNGITNDYMLEIVGLCSLEPKTDRLWVTCLVGKGTYKRHHLGLSDNVTYFAEQVEPVKASAYHYRVTFKPQVILPDIDFRGSVDDGPRSQSPAQSNL